VRRFIHGKSFDLLLGTFMKYCIDFCVIMFYQYVAVLFYP
jgi:hypothetical protein